MNFKQLSKVSIVFFSLLFSINAFSQTSSDSDVTASVKNKIAAEKSLSGAKINVTAANGVVSLSGKVDSNTQASEATQIAQSTPGVNDVDTSQLTVNGSNQPMTDLFITAKVKGMFIQEKLFGDKDIAAMGIKVETNDGIVSLSGKADNQDQINNAIKIAKKVGGVKDVKSDVKVSVVS